jgi:serine/threonine protein kinase
VAYDEWNRMYLDEWGVVLRAADGAGVLPRLLRVVDDRDDLWLGFEWLPRVPLRVLLKSDGGKDGLALPLVRSIVHGIARGLARIHQEPLVVIHRDVSPRTVTLATDGTVHVDWRAWRHDTAAVTRTAGIIRGSFDSMSPEQVRGEPLTPASDVFSLGTVAFHALCGRSAFRRESDIDTLRAIFEDDRPRVHDHRPDVPDELGRLIERMLERVPLARPTPAEIVEVLARDLAWATWDDEACARELRSLVPREVEAVLALDDQARAALMRGAP